MQTEREKNLYKHEILLNERERWEHGKENLMRSIFSWVLICFSLAWSKASFNTPKVIYVRERVDIIIHWL
jgi:hypothetical protein